MSAITIKQLVVDYVGDEVFYILFDPESGSALQRQMLPIDPADPSRGHYAGYACFESEEDARSCLATMPERVKKRHKPRRESLKMILANANADGLYAAKQGGVSRQFLSFGALVFDRTGKIVTKVIVGE